MNTRLNILRNYLNLSQAEFGNKINLSKSTISALESGTRAISNRVISDICDKYNVNEAWFRSGTGEMFAETKNFSLDELFIRFNADELDKKIIEAYLKMNNENRQAFKAYVINLASEIDADKQPEPTEEIAEENDIEKELELYRQELLAEKGAKARLKALPDADLKEKA